MLEEWKPVIGYEGLYEVSSLGRVRSLDRYYKNRHGGRTPINGKILKLVLHRTGYLVVSLYKENPKTGMSLPRRS